MSADAKTSLILRRPFLSMANAHIDVGAGEIQLNINGQEEKFYFKPKQEQCLSFENKSADTTILDEMTQTLSFMGGSHDMEHLHEGLR